MGSFRVGDSGGIPRSYTSQSCWILRREFDMANDLLALEKHSREHLHGEKKIL